MATYAADSERQPEGETKQDAWRLKGKALEEMLAEAKERFEHSIEVDGTNDKHAREDARFVWIKGEQWPSVIRKERETVWNQPCLEASQLPQFLKQVVNDQRQSRPGIRVSAASGEASEETAKLYQEMCRHIEYDSRAEHIYDTAFEHAVTSGRGYWRIVSEYEDADSFNQKLVIKSVADFQAVRVDPDYQEPDGSDKGWAFVVTKMKKSAFEKAYPKASALDWQTDSKWFPTSDEVVVADYYRRVCTKRTLVAMSDGNIGWKDDLPKVLPAGIKIMREREADDYSIEWFTVAGGQQCLEQYEWPGTIVPVIQDTGDEMMIDGKRVFQGLIRRVRDLQQAYNYLISAAMERTALAPKQPYIMAEGQVEGHEQEWATANTLPHPYLEYKPKTLDDGSLLPAPQRQAPFTAEMGFFQQAEMLKQDIKSVLGMYENSLGMKSQETSGRAILAREKQGDNATFNFVDNLSRAIALTGRILVELIPHYYDTQRVVGIVGADDTRSTTTINEVAPDPNDPTQTIIKNNVKEGKFAVTVECGPSYATRRKESAETLTQMVQAFPPIMQAAGDLVVKAQEIPDAPELSKRMKHLLLPAVQQELAQEQAEKDGQAPIPPEAQAQMAQQQQQLGEAQQIIQGMQAEIQKLQSGAAEKQAAAQVNAQAKVQEAEIGAGVDAQSAQLQAQTELQKAQLDARTELEKAQMQAQVALEKARIEAETKLQIADMNSQADERVKIATAPPAGPNDAQMLAQTLSQTAEAIVAALSGEREIEITSDANGNVIGGKSRGKNAKQRPAPSP